MGKHTRALVFMGLIAVPVIPAQAQMLRDAAPIAKDWIGQLLHGPISKEEVENALRKGPAVPPRAMDRLPSFTAQQMRDMFDVFQQAVAIDMSAALNTSFEHAIDFEKWIVPVIDDMFHGDVPDTLLVPEELKSLMERAGREGAKKCQALLQDKTPPTLLTFIKLPTPPDSVSHAEYTCTVLYDAGVVIAKVYVKRFKTLGTMIGMVNWVVRHRDDLG